MGDYWASIEVNGSCESPPDDNTLTPSPPADTTGPSFDSGYLVWESCQFFGTADLLDSSGISWAKFGYNLNGQGMNWIWMSDTGSGWQAEVGISVMDGIGTLIGNIEYQFQASDGLNNESYSGTYSYNYTSCDG